MAKRLRNVLIIIIGLLVTLLFAFVFNTAKEDVYSLNETSSSIYANNDSYLSEDNGIYTFTKVAGEYCTPTGDAGFKFVNNGFDTVTFEMKPVACQYLLIFNDAGMRPLKPFNSYVTMTNQTIGENLAFDAEANADGYTGYDIMDSSAWYTVTMNVTGLTNIWLAFWDGANEGSVLIKNVSFSDNVVADMNVTGVNVKYSESGETVSGLRFTGRINKDLIDGKAGVEYGMLFLPKHLYVGAPVYANTSSNLSESEGVYTLTKNAGRSNDANAENAFRVVNAVNASILTFELKADSCKYFMIKHLVDVNYIALTPFSSYVTMTNQTTGVNLTFDSSANAAGNTGNVIETGVWYKVTVNVSGLSDIWLGFWDLADSGSVQIKNVKFNGGSAYDLAYNNVGYGRVAKANCTGKIESDGDYYNIAAYLSGIQKNNYNCDYYAVVYIKDGPTYTYSAPKHAAIAQTAKYLVDNNLDVEHNDLLDDFILRYPVKIYGYGGSEVGTVYVKYGEVASIPSGKNHINGYTGYFFDKYVISSGSYIKFDETQIIKGTTSVYSTYDEGRDGVILKDLDTGVGDCGSVDITVEDDSLVTVLTSSNKTKGTIAFSDAVWTEYINQQNAEVRVVKMDIKFGGTVSLAGFAQSTTGSLDLNTIRNNKDYFRFYNGDTLLDYNDLTTDVWYQLEIDIHAIKNITGGQGWNSGNSSLVLARESAGTISVKGVSFPYKYDEYDYSTKGYQYFSMTNFDDASFNVNEWYLNSTRNTDGVGLYADEETSGNGCLNFDGAAINSVFGTKQQHQNFELSFDIYGAKTSNANAPTGVSSAATSELRILFGDSSLNYTDDSDSALNKSMGVFIGRNMAGTSTDVIIFDHGQYENYNDDPSKPLGYGASLPIKYGFFSNGYSGGPCRIKITVNDNKISVFVKYVYEKEYTTVIDSFNPHDTYSGRTIYAGYVLFQGYGNQFTSDREIHRSSHYKIDNVVLGDLTSSMLIQYSPAVLNPPAEYNYTPRNVSDIEQPYNTAS